MNLRAFILTACLLLPLDLRAQVSAYLSSGGTRAVDARDVRHDGNTYPRKHPPWLDDIVKTARPDYSYADRSQHHTGVGWFAIYLDLKTGVPTRIGVLKSTGFASLDNCAIASFRRWRWKPAKWKEIDMPVTFTLASGPPRPLPAGALNLPSR